MQSINPSRCAPIVRPTNKPTVYQLLGELGHDVRDWSVSTVTGLPINPHTNTYRNSQWAFVDPAGEPAVVCLWFMEIEHEADPAYYDGNDRKYRNDLLKAAEFSRENLKKNLRRLRAWEGRSRKLEDVVSAAFYKRQPLRVVIVGGTRKDELDRELAELPNLDAASEVETRGMDSAFWWVHTYDDATGAYRIYRDVPLPPAPEKPDPATLDPASDPLLVRYLETLDETVREAIIKARVGQGLFREQLISRWGGQCSVTGVKAPELLVASHIRPWSQCDTAEQRISPANGLLLTPNLDKLFDKGLISFDGNCRMMISPKLSAAVQTHFNLSQHMRLRQSHADSFEYLQWHRETYFLDGEDC